MYATYRLRIYIYIYIYMVWEALVFLFCFFIILPTPRPEILRVCMVGRLYVCMVTYTEQEYGSTREGSVEDQCTNIIRAIELFCYL